MKTPTFYIFRSKDGLMAGSIWADSVTTRPANKDDAYCTTFGTFFYLRGALQGEIWSDCLDWRAAG